MTDLVGWVATAVFVASYFCTRADALRRLQMVGATIWMGYGLLMQAPPVVAANVLVLGAAAWTAKRQARGAVNEATASQRAPAAPPMAAVPGIPPSWRPDREV